MPEQPILFVNLPRQYESLRVELTARFNAVLDRAAFVGGPFIEEFESKLAAYTGARFAISCSDGTLALVLALVAAGLRKGDRVIVPTNSYIATANAVVHAGGIPVFADCDQNDFLIDRNHLEALLKKEKAAFIIPVHLYGNPCPMDEISALAERYRVRILEDNAQALGASYRGRKTGTFGLACGISFYPAKNLGAFGQAGAILTDDEGLARKVKVYREQGAGNDRYIHEVVGYNGRMDSLHASFLSLLLDRLDSWNAGRLSAADAYAARLPHKRLQKRTPHGVHVYHLFEYRTDSEAHRERVVDVLKKNNIGFGFHYPVPIHRQQAYKEFNSLSLPNAESLARTLISLPMHPFLSDRDISLVCSLLDSLA